MVVCLKKPLTLPTSSVYFDPSKDRVFNTFASQNTYQSRQQRIEGYECRLYWQFLYCQSVGCPTYFYTLTYNDSNVPHKYGVSCFDYEDLRDLLTGGFRKQLLRKHGVTFKYFIGAELGDGKGKRGLHNNPHYHILFFLEPANNPEYPLNLPSPVQFRRLVRIYWQGFDQDLGFKDFRSKSKYGIVKEGENLGLVTDYRACFYCAKYVSKDVKLKMKELDIPKLLRLSLKNKLLEDVQFYRDFVRDIVFPLYSIPSRSGFNETVGVLFSRLLYPITEFIDRLTVKYDYDEFFDNDETFIISTKLICSKYFLWKEFYKYLNQRIEKNVVLAINEWRNRYCNKVRVSHGLGDYALVNIDLDNPLIKVPSKDGFKYRNLCLYYYRKLFTGVVKPNECFFNNRVYKASPVRVLTQAGIDYKVKNLESRIPKVSEESINSLMLLKSDKNLFDRMRSSDVNIDVKMNYEEFIERLAGFDDFSLICNKYAEYRLVYQHRSFQIDIRKVINFPEINLLEDYRKFLQPSVFSVPRSDLRVEEFLSGNNQNFMSYDLHPYFLRYLFLFKVIETFNDYLFVCSDDYRQEIAENLAEIRRFHKLRKLHNL